MGEKRARLAVLALVLIAPALYLPRVLFGSAPQAPLDQPPTWTHLVVVSVGAWPDLDESLGCPAIARLDRRASRVGAVFAPSASRAATAASLWTGRWPRHHGVLADDLALAHGTWTIAQAARRAGARSAAFLQEPFVSSNGVSGFERVEEDPDLAPGERGAAFLVAHPDERLVLWLHLATAGTRGERLERLLATLEPALEPRRAETTLVLAVFARGEYAGSTDALGAPLWVALPGALYAGRRSDGRLSLVDVTGVLRRLLRLPPPREDQGERAPQSRTDALAVALAGASPRPWVLVQAAPGGEDVWRLGDRRVVARWASGEARVEVLTGGVWRGIDDPGGLIDEARRVAWELGQGRTAARGE